MPISITYIAIAILTVMGVENAETVVNAAVIVAIALVGLWGRWRAGGLKAWWGLK